MAAENAFIWGSLLHPIEETMLQNGIDPHPSIDVTVAAVIIIVLAWFGGRKYRISEIVQPTDKLTFSSFMETAVGILYGFVKGFLGDKTDKLFPFLGTAFIFILINNLLGVVPGFNPPTDKFSVTIVLAIMVFVVYHLVGISVHGTSYIKQFVGPVWWLSWLIFPIEVISHCVRPFSLALRLFGNMTGDHKVLTIFFGLVPYLLPVPFLGLGVFVSCVQAFVFLLLSLVYIAGAADHAH